MIRVDLDVMLSRRKMSVTELSEKVGITMANISILKTGKAKAVRFSTLEDYSAMAMVANGLGISVMNALLLTNCPFDLVQKPLDPPQHLTFGVAVRSWEQASPAVRKFCAYARGILTSDDYDSQK